MNDGFIIPSCCKGMATKFIVTSFFLLFHFIFHSSNGIRAEKVPDASSTLLRMHRLYVQQPPHDTTLYDILEVNPNATVAQITKSYRKLSRRYHPDKHRKKSRHSTNNDDEKDQGENDQQLERIREAYEVLKVDRTRLLYHRFGLVDTVHAVYLLTGRFEKAISSDPNLKELLYLMGYALDDLPPPPPPLIHPETSGATNRPYVGNQFRHKQEHNQRVKFIATNIVGLIRPLVEGSVDEAFLADLVVTQCDRLKKLPMGAQIIRCIGRAYRYAGRRVLRRYRANPKSFGIEKEQRFSKSNLITNPSLISLSDGFRDHLRHAEHIIQAAVATGKIIISKSGATSEKKHGEELDAFISQDNEMGEIPENLQNIDCLSGFFPPDEDEMRRSERSRAQKAIFESLQVDALWKISKIDLDRTVREACNLVLDGSMFFGQEEGWVGSSGLVISSNVARIRAAAALAMIGEVMVQRSKEGTAWME